MLVAVCVIYLLNPIKLDKSDEEKLRIDENVVLIVKILESVLNCCKPAINQLNTDDF